MAHVSSRLFSGTSSSTVEPEFVGDSLGAAGIANSGPWLDDDDLAILYDKFQDLLYMAVPQHVNPRIFVKRW